MLIRLIAAAAALLMAKPAAAADVPIPCERACMETIAEQVLQAMVAHDSSRLPLARDSQTGQQMGFHNGLWRTASKVGAYRHVFADPASGQIGVFATLDENGRP
jgi:hypothetical protein